MVCSAVKEGWDLYTENNKQQLHKHTEEPPQEGKTQLYTCIWRTKDGNIHIPDWDDRWFERGLKEDISAMNYQHWTEVVAYLTLGYFTWSNQWLQGTSVIVPDSVRGDMLCSF